MQFIRILSVVVISITALGLDTLSAQPRRNDSRINSRVSRELGTAVISAANGDVRAHDSRTGDWVSAHASMVLENGDRLATGVGSRAEIEFGVANFARLNSGTEIVVGDLGNRSYQISVAEGELTYSMWKHAEADVLIEVGDVLIRPLKPGAYRVRIERAADCRHRSKRRRGNRIFQRDPAGRKRRTHHTIAKRDDNGRYDVAKARGKDQFDKWSERRDDILRQDVRRRNWYRGGRLYAYGGYPYHMGFGYYPYRRFGFGFGTSFSRRRYRGRRFRR